VKRCIPLDVVRHQLHVLYLCQPVRQVTRKVLDARHSRVVVYSAEFVFVVDKDTVNDAVGHVEHIDVLSRVVGSRARDEARLLECVIFIVGIELENADVVPQLSVSDEHICTRFIALYSQEFVRELGIDFLNF